MAKRTGSKKEEKGAMQKSYDALQVVEQQLFGTNKEENKMTTVKVKHSMTGEVAEITEDYKKRVSVTRAGMTTDLGTGHTLESVTEQFTHHDWEVQVEPTLFVSDEVDPVDESIPLSVLKEVDEYLDLHVEAAKLKAKMEKLKKSVRGYMDKNELTEIKGSNGKKVALQEGKASNSTSIFTDYEYTDIAAALNDNELLRQVTEVRINGDKLKGLLALNKLSKEKVEEINGLKIAKDGTPKFVVKNV